MSADLPPEPARTDSEYRPLSRREFLQNGLAGTEAVAVGLGLLPRIALAALTVTPTADSEVPTAFAPTEQEARRRFRRLLTDRDRYEGDTLGAMERTFRFYMTTTGSRACRRTRTSPRTSSSSSARSSGSWRASPHLPPRRTFRGCSSVATASSGSRFLRRHDNGKSPLELAGADLQGLDWPLVPSSAVRPPLQHSSGCCQHLTKPLELTNTFGLHDLVLSC